jgi:hypothetical protein
MSTTSGEGIHEVNAQMELLMRHSSPVVRAGQEVTSPLSERNTSPSTLRMHRPRSNPRNRTPMRFESPLQSYRIREGENEGEAVAHEARRITIRPMAGSAVGNTVLTARVSGCGREQSVEDAIYLCSFDALIIFKMYNRFMKTVLSEDLSSRVESKVPLIERPVAGIMITLSI